MSKNLQVSSELVTDVFKLIILLESVELPLEVLKLMESIKDQIDAKLERMDRRETYLKSRIY